jgi:D-3-phosphoglycerate dehydrogenase
MPKVLISDKLSPAAVEIFRARGIEADVKTELKKDELKSIIGAYDGLAVRSATKVTGDVIQAAGNLKVIGRAGIGVDNIDVAAATQKGIVVMNTPFGNSITTAEHAIALLFALAREIPAADSSTQAGKWEKQRFLGVELTGKTLGIIGCGNIGSIVADRALGLKMKVLAYDPYLTPERAIDLGVEKVDLDTLFRRADFVTLHTPLTDQTRGIINAKAIAKMKKGVRIINCARGGLVVEQDLKAALDSGTIAGAALDVFEEEPAKKNILFGHPKIVATPHLGASTSEAQENVALQVAEQMSDYLLTGAVMNAVNMPSISAEEAPRLRPYVRLAEQLGQFAGQLVESGMSEIEIQYSGEVGELNTKALTAAALAGLLRPILSEVNMVNAPVVARERGIMVKDQRQSAHGAYESYVLLRVRADGETVSVAGTVFSDGKPRIVQVKGIDMEAEVAPHMIYVLNMDKPGLIGRVGMLLAEENVNIASLHLGRVAPGAEAVALISVDGDIGPALLARIRAIPNVMQAKALSF